MEKSDVKVSVLCTAYNHEKFLRKCLDGFVMQKTNFKYEVIVHDDASTDGTKEIIEEYVKKYPELIKPIYQTQNQYSIDINIMDNILFPIAKGKYIAICEGDDYWCDEKKLQIQYDFMEEHLDCSACFHNTIKHDLSNSEKDKNFNNWTDVHFMTEKEVFSDWLVHTSSLFVNRDIFKKEEYAQNYWFGDYVCLTTYFSKGKIAVLPQIMSVYNVNNIDGVTKKIYRDTDKERILSKLELRIEYLTKFNDFTNQKYQDHIYAAMFSFYNDIYNVYFDDDYKSYILNLKNNKYIKYYYNLLSLKQKIKFFIKIHCPIWFYKLVRKLKKR